MNHGPHIKGSTRLDGDGLTSEDGDEKAAEKGRNKDFHKKKFPHGVPLPHAGKEHADNGCIDKERIPEGDWPFVRPLIHRGQRIVVRDFVPEVIHNVANGFCTDFSNEDGISRYDDVEHQTKEEKHARRRYIGKPLIDTRHAGNDEKAGHNNGQDEVHKGSLRDAKDGIDTAADLHKTRCHGV